jgi:ribose 5-phosphate isomerase B
MSRLITESDVRTAHDRGQPIAVSGPTIVTPAARDLAHHLGVAIREHEPPTSSDEATRRLAIGADHGGTSLKEVVKPILTELGYDVMDVGSHGSEPVDYPVFAARVAEAVSRGEASLGIMIDGAGIGSAMVANKIPGVRAALCYDLTTAANAREHNNANVLTLGGSLIGSRLAGDIVRTFVQTPFGGGRHQRRVAMIDGLDAMRNEPA